MKESLGRGLGALLQNVPDFIDENATSREIATELIDTDPEQPRRLFDEARLKELAQSIEIHGIMQPLVVMETGERYRIIAGERRFRAAQMAGLKLVPVVIRDADAQAALELALIENLQREDLNPIEQASALDRLMREHSLTQEQVAVRVGKSRSTIANLTRLLSLPESAAALVSEGSLSLGHAKVLLSLEDPEALVQAAKTVVESGMSVRETENFVRALRRPEHGEWADAAVKPTAKRRSNAVFKEAQEQLASLLGTRVRIAGTEDKGRITIEYGSREQLEHFFDQLKSLDHDYEEEATDVVLPD